MRRNGLTEAVGTAVSVRVGVGGSVGVWETGPVEGIGEEDVVLLVVEEAVDVTGGDAIPTRTSELGDLVRVAIAAARHDLAERSTEGIEGLPENTGPLPSMNRVVAGIASEGPTA